MVTSGQSVNESQRHKNGCSLAVVCPCFHTVEFCCNLCGLCTQERQLITVFTLKSHSSQTVFTLKRHSSQLSLHSRDTAHNCLYTQETQLTTVFTLKRHSSQLSLHSLTMQPGVCLGVYIHDEAKWSLLSINQNVLHMYCNSFCFGPPEYDSFRLPNKEQKKVVGFSFSSQTMSSLI